MIMWKRRYENDFIDRMVNDPMYALKVTGFALLLVFIAWGLYTIITYRKVVHTKVTEIGWDTRIDVYRWQTNNHGGWSIPNGGRETNSYMAQSGTRRVRSGSHRECSGSGKDRSCRTVDDYRYEPVYDRWYEYDIEEWTMQSPLTAKGNTIEWYMPDTTDGTYTDGTNPIIGDLRLGTQYTHFFIVYTDEDTKYPVDMTESPWKQHTLGDQYELTLDFFGTVKAINKLGSDW